MTIGKRAETFPLPMEIVMKVHRYDCSWGEVVPAPPYYIALARAADLASVCETGGGTLPEAVHATRQFAKRHRRALGQLSMRDGSVNYDPGRYRPADEVDPAGILDAIRTVLEAARNSPDRMSSRDYDDPRTTRAFLQQRVSLDLVLDLICLHGKTLSGFGSTPPVSNPEPDGR